MGIREAEQFVQLVRENPDESIFAGGCSEAEIGQAERQLGVAFPKSYKFFLCELGDCDVAGEEIYGIVIRDGQMLGAVTETLDLRDSAGMPPHLVAFRPDGMGGYFTFDTSKMSPEGEAPVFVWGAGTRSATESEYIGSDFGTVVLGLAQRGLGA